jgi:hypothetical protein
MNLALWLERAGMSHGDRPALGLGSRVVRSYAECAGRVARLAASLRQRFGLEAECKAALRVNPYDPDSVAAAVGQALSMPPAQRRERHDALFQVLSHNDIQHWADRFLAALESEPTALSQLEQMPSVES